MKTHTETSPPASELSKFLDMMAIERGVSSNTIMAYRRDIGDMLAKIKKEATAINTEDILNYLQNRNESISTRNRKISSLRQFFLFLQTDNLRHDNPMTFFKTPSLPRPIPKYLTEDQISILFQYLQQSIKPDDKRLYAMLELLYGTGLRASELVSLPTSAISRDGDYLIVMGKGRKERMLPLTPRTTQAVQDYQTIRNHFIPRSKNSIFLFPSNGSSGHLTRQHLDQMLKDLSAKVNLPKLSAHMLRHSLATHLLHRGVDLPTLQSILRHEDLSTTQIYTHIPDDSLRETMIRCHPLGAQQ